VITENESRSETVQGLTLILGEIAGLGVYALGNQDLFRSLARLSCPSRKSFRGLSEVVERLAAADIDGNPASVFPVYVKLHISWYTAAALASQFVARIDGSLASLKFQRTYS
jgi:hypothetical protein